METDKRVITEPSNDVKLMVTVILHALCAIDPKPQDVLFLLGESVLRVLVGLAEDIGYDAGTIVKVFGEGLTTAKIELEEKPRREQEEYN